MDAIYSKEDIMRKTALFFLLSAFLSLVLAGAVFADNHAVKQAEKAGIGKFLTDAKGLTLYIFKKDSPGKSVCTGTCVDNWPLYFREKVVAPTELNAGDFDTITREDGKKQTTYKGWPLYYYVGDTSAGDTNGQGKKDIWYVADPGLAAR